uniref:MYND-type domain-containing protein n=1 Tax=Rhizophagus irregularis (strain DAOM 181602 / DAOM 197198 / MUCL 43194) TaxID=747089 RepID=U9TZN2_RHIID
MRESNFSFPSQNRASVCITAALYDRRALDCTAILPLINSLTHLTYLTSTSPRIREILTMDGGLERLVRILKTTKVNDKRSGWKWSMAFQCVANVGVRGSETIRTRVVDAGMVPVIITVLDNFLKALDHVRLEKEQQQLLAAQLLSTQHPSLITTTTTPSPSMPLAAAFVGALENGNASNTIQMSEDLRPSQLPSNTNNNSTNPTSQSSTLEIDVLYREEDILLSLQLLAYLSKYPHLRATFHTAYPPHNVFSLVEKFTHRLHPAEIQYWAGVIMRNACRKDEARGGIRQCAYMACGKWESYPREFAKCRRCRKAKYCSKACQSKAWSEGHRWWCMERHGHGDTDSTSANGQSNSNGTSSSLGGHRSRSTNFGHSTDSLARSTTNREATPTTVTTGATSHGRGSSGSGSVLVS